MKLMHILLEAEQDKQESEVLDQLKGQMSSLVKTIDTTLQDKTEEQNESLLTIASVAIALPAILGAVARFGKSASAVVDKILGKKPTEKEKEKAWYEKLGKMADQLHHLYQVPLEKIMSKFIKDPQKAKHVAHFIFHVIIGVLLISSGATAIKALHSKNISLATLEVALVRIKQKEIKKYKLHFIY